ATKASVRTWVLCLVGQDGLLVGLRRHRKNRSCAQAVTHHFSPNAYLQGTRRPVVEARRGTACRHRRVARPMLFHRAPSRSPTRSTTRDPILRWLSLATGR